VKHRVVCACLIVLLGGLFVEEIASAQEVELPVTPDPEQCVAEPLTVEEISAMIARATPAATEESTNEPEEFTLPVGEPADEETVQEITAFLVHAEACVNARDLLAVLSFFGEDIIVELIGTDVTPEDLAALPPATPEPRENWHTLLDVRDVTILDDGRVGALVDVFSPEDGPMTSYFVFVRQDNTWTIDEVVPDLEEQYPPEATPAARHFNKSVA
jgi:hypothetical protein